MYSRFADNLASDVKLYDAKGSGIDVPLAALKTLGITPAKFAHNIRKSHGLFVGQVGAEVRVFAVGSDRNAWLGR